MKFFIDTEFIESGPGKPIHLLSIGAVTLSGSAFYGEVLDAPVELANNWVRENVLPQLGVFETAQSLNRLKNVECHMVRENLDVLGRKFRDWVEEQCSIIGVREKPEFWGYYADYDWVVICQMFGAMVDLPKGWPMFCLDIKQWCHQLGNPELPVQKKDSEHNALHDALWNRQSWGYLNNLKD